MDAAVERFRLELEKRLPASKLSIDAPVHTPGSYWLDVEFLGERETIEHTPHGFGFFDRASTYGERPTAYIHDPIAAAVEAHRKLTHSANPAALSLVVIRAHDIDRLGLFYSKLGITFTRHRHGTGPEHLSGSAAGGAIFEIYPIKHETDSTASTRLGFSVPSLSKALDDLRALDAPILSEPSDTEFGRRAVVKDFEGHKVELYESCH